MKYFSSDNIGYLEGLEEKEALAIQDRQDGNEYGHDVLTDEVSAALYDLGLGRKELRDLGWEL